MDSYDISWTWPSLIFCLSLSLWLLFFLYSHVTSTIHIYLQQRGVHILCGGSGGLLTSSFADCLEQLRPRETSALVSVLLGSAESQATTSRLLRQTIHRRMHGYTKIRYRSDAQLRYFITKYIQDLIFFLFFLDLIEILWQGLWVQCWALSTYVCLCQ